MAKKDFRETLRTLLVVAVLAICAAVLAPANAAWAAETDTGEPLAEQPGIEDVKVGDTIEGSVDADHMSCIYALTLPNSGIVHLDVTSSASYGIYLHTSPYGGEMREYRIWQDSGYVKGDLPMREDAYEIVLDAGTYYLEMSRQYYSSSIPSFTIQTSLETYPATETEPNDTLKEANLFVPGEDISGVISVRHDSDWYRFTLPESKILSLSMTAEIQCYELHIYNDQSTDYIWTSGTTVWNDSTRIIKKNYHIALNAGTYYLQVGTWLGWGSSGPYSIKTSLSAPSVDMYRMYNPNTGEHLYTASQVERDSMVASGWKYEGVMWRAPGASSTPVYRLYNPNTHDHHYANTLNEYETCMRSGWKGEGVAFYSDDARGVPVYRLFNPNVTGVGTHHYTTSTAERNANVKSGWKYESVGWYGLK